MVRKPHAQCLKRSGRRIVMTDAARPDDPWGVSDSAMILDAVASVMPHEPLGAGDLSN
jgi:hypothetical protein